VLEEECLSQQRIQLIQHPLHELLIFTRPHRRTVRCVQQQRFFPHEHSLSMRPASRYTATLINEDSIQPSAESVPLLVPIERPISPEEGRLQRIFRVVPVAQHPDCKPRAPVVVPVHQRGVRLNVSREHALNVCGIVAHVLFYNPPPSG